MQACVPLVTWCVCERVPLVMWCVLLDGVVGPVELV